jgi:hypothetical protein
MKKSFSLLAIALMAISASAQPCDAVVQVSPRYDTICDGENVSIKLTSPESIDTLRFRYTAEAPPGVTVMPGSDVNLPLSYTIADQIVNTTDNAQLALLIVTPYLINSDGTENCVGSNDTAYIWVKPKPDILTVTVDNVIEDPCEGSSKGAIEITVTGGTASYQFSWDGPLGIIRDTEDIYDIPGGPWDLTVSDSDTMVADTTIYVPIASGMLVSTIESQYGPPGQVYNISEYGKSDGWIWVEYVLYGSGDPNEYAFIWEHNGWETNTGFQDTLSGLGAGKYTLEVVDTVGCTGTVMISLYEPSPETAIDTVEVIKFLEVADEATLINPVTQATIWVKNYGDFIRASESFDLCKVYNMTGSIIKQVSNKTDIPVSDLQTGIYIFYLKFGQAKIVQRFYIK